MSMAFVAALALMMPSQDSLSRQEPDPRGDQWVLGATGGDGQIAAFVDWNYTTVLFRAHCDGARLAFQYFYTYDREAWGVADQQEDRPLAVIVDDRVFPLSEETDDRGRTVHMLDAQGIQALTGGGYVQFDAPNEMDEAWHLGEAGPLIAVARGCE